MSGSDDQDSTAPALSPTVTAIEKQKRRPRADLYLDGVYACTLGIDLIFERHIAVGTQITDTQRRDLETDDQRRGAIAAALRLLSVMPRSEQDLRDRLKHRDFRRTAVDAAITRMRELGYLDDAAFARFWIEARQAATPRSRRALAFELSRKGIDRDLVSETIAPLSDADAAYAAAQRRLRSLCGLDRPGFTRRLGSFLASRGFSYAVARSAIDRCWAELTADEPV
ncbi:MAG: RecX family transcriptional regulator [Dehalococcoidia bacterium]|nr:RecX family transcriptional regulator [Dehalococcoidia bacterium]